MKKELIRKIINYELTVVIAVILLILLPPIANGEISKPINVDTIEHIVIMERMSNGVPVQFIYFGQAIVGYPIVWIHNVTGIYIMNLFVWFNYLALICAILTIYFVVSRLVNKTAGIISIPIALFCTLSNLRLFSCGAIFNIINMSIILPWAGYFAIKLITGKKRKIINTLLFVVPMAIFATFHTTGSYITASALWKLIEMPPGYSAVPSVFDYIFVFLSGTTFALLISGAIGFAAKKLWKNIDKKTVLFLVSLIIISAGLTAVTYSDLSPAPVRQVMDATTVLAILTACVTGIVLVNFKSRILTCVIIVIIAIGAFPGLNVWIK